MSRQRILSLGPSLMPVATRARLGLPTIALLVVPALFGHFLIGLLMGLGSYTVLYGGVPGRRHRAAVMAATGVGLVTAVCAGLAASGSVVAPLVAYVAAALLGVALDEAVPLGHPARTSSCSWSEAAGSSGRRASACRRCCPGW